MLQDNESTDWAAAALAAAGDAGYEWDLTTDAIVWSDGGRLLFGAATLPAYSSGSALNGRVHPEDLPRRLAALSEHYRTGEPYDCTYRVRRPDGLFLSLHDRGRAEMVCGTPARLRGIVRQVAGRQRWDDLAARRACVDELTGRCNRVQLRSALEVAMAECQSTFGGYLSVGIDQLTLVNDAYGYEVADTVIVAVGQRLSRVVGDESIVGRVGGDVFGVVLRGMSVEDVVGAAERILAAFREHAVHTPAGLVHVSVSIGGVVLPSSADASFEAMTRAETAMRQAKLSGRDCFCLYTGTEQERRDNRRLIALGEQLKNALKNNRIALAFQPVIDPRTGAVAFNECLFRMIAADGEIVPASHLIPAAEQLGLVRQLDRRVLELAIDVLVRRPDGRLAINVSAHTVADSTWLVALRQLIGGRPALAERLVVEITETAAIRDLEHGRHFVSNVRRLGARVALDDFGAGYTSFRHLKTMTIDAVKIDGSFTTDIGGKLENRLFVRSLVGLAKGFGLLSVAERVETLDDAEALLEEGVDLLQGYLFAQPRLDHPWDGEPPDRATSAWLLAPRAELACGRAKPPRLLGAAQDVA